MTTHYNAQFKYLGQVLTIGQTITDKQEDRGDIHKRSLASSWMTDKLRGLGIYQNNCIYSRDLVQVKREEKVKDVDLLEQIAEAQRVYDEMPNDITKLVIAMAHGHGVM